MPQSPHPNASPGFAKSIQYRGSEFGDLPLARLAVLPQGSYLTSLIFRDEIIKLIIVTDGISNTVCQALYYINITSSVSPNNEIKYVL